jgi:hypothetical protein
VWNQGLTRDQSDGACASHNVDDESSALCDFTCDFENGISSESHEAVVKLFAHILHPQLFKPGISDKEARSSKASDCEFADLIHFEFHDQSLALLKSKCSPHSNFETCNCAAGATKCQAGPHVSTHQSTRH